MKILQWLKDRFRNVPFGALRSNQWPELRREFLQYNPLCAVCEKNRRIELHHIFPFYIRPDLELSKNNLIQLCREHHFLFGHLLDFKKFNLQVRKDAKEWNNKIKNVIKVVN